ncbi:MAG: LUD domain-containing protein, partial [Clostridia bacterium]|nr:LUD domain-containing protein [Clostridia bacterium]
MDAILMENMRKRNFTVHEAKNAEEAKAIALSIIGERSVGIGGSKTVRQLGLYDALKAQGNIVHWHWTV